MHILLVALKILTRSFVHHNIISGGIGTRNPIFGYQESAKKIVALRQVEEGFSSFFAIIDDFSKCRTPKVLRNFGKIIKIGTK